MNNRNIAPVQRRDGLGTRIGEILARSGTGAICLHRQPRRSDAKGLRPNAGWALKIVSSKASTAAPVASFSWTAKSRAAPPAVALTGAGSGSIACWSSYVGKGAISTGKNICYRYASTGTYAVYQTVIARGDSNTAPDTGFIAVSASTSALNSGGGPVSSAGLVATHSFDEASGSKALDTSSDGGHGDLINVPGSRTGKLRNALSFDGSNSLVTGNDSAYPHPTNAMPLSAWVYPTSCASRWATLLQKERSGVLAHALNPNSDTGQKDQSGAVSVQMDAKQCAQQLAGLDFEHRMSWSRGSV